MGRRVGARVPRANGGAAAQRYQRHDATHKLTTQLIHENQVIAAESLQVKNLLQYRRHDAAERPHLGLSGLRDSRHRPCARNILQAGKVILAGADKLRHHERTTVGHAGG